MEVAHSSGAAVAVDAAARIPPASNLSYYSKAGADAVIFSGGKHMRGPQTSGLLVARREIIAAARLNGSPNEEAICRPMKVSKEGVVAFVAALRAFLAEEDGSAVGARCDPYSHAVQIRMLVAAGRKVVGGGGAGWAQSSPAVVMDAGRPDGRLRGVGGAHAPCFRGGGGGGGCPARLPRGRVDPAQRHPVSAGPSGCGWRLTDLTGLLAMRIG
jgi:hypothetical protein